MIVVGNYFPLRTLDTGILHTATQLRPSMIFASVPICFNTPHMYHSTERAEALVCKRNPVSSKMTAHQGMQHHPQEWSLSPERSADQEWLAGLEDHLHMMTLWDCLLPGLQA